MIKSTRLRRLALKALVLIGILPSTACLQNPTAPELLARTIAYHDPEGKWSTLDHSLVLRETRPDGTFRKTSLLLENSAGIFHLKTTRGEDRVQAELSPEGCSAKLNGASEIDPTLIEKYRLSCQGLAWWRNYYGYLYGLPMKLRDPGTRLSPIVTRQVFNDRQADVLKVDYAESVGKDTWYFYLDPDTSALIGYRFYHDESKNDGEYIVLEGEVEANNIRLPQNRTWYTNGDQKLLGTDILKSYQNGTDLEPPL